MTSRQLTEVGYWGERGRLLLRRCLLSSPSYPSVTLSWMAQKRERRTIPPKGPLLKPFGGDEDKQMSYELFLRMKDKGMKDKFRSTLPSSLTEWEKSKEEREFERASQLYKPLSFTMATRFVSSSCDVIADPLLKEGLNVPIKREPSSSTPTQTPPPTPPPTTTAVSSDPRVNAARSSMFGLLTQMVEDWCPDSLLCRRFNVPNPYPE